MDDISPEEELERLYQTLNSEDSDFDTGLKGVNLLIIPYREPAISKTMLSDLKLGSVIAKIPNISQFSIRQIGETPQFGVYKRGFDDPFMIGIVKGSGVNHPGIRERFHWHVTWNVDTLTREDLILNMFSLDELQNAMQQARDQNTALKGKYNELVEIPDSESPEDEFTMEDFESHWIPGMTKIDILDRWLVQEWANFAIETVYGKFDIATLSHRGLIGLITDYVKKADGPKQISFPSIKTLFDLYKDDAEKVIDVNNNGIVSWDFYINAKWMGSNPPVFPKKIPQPFIASFVHGYRNDLKDPGPVCYFIPFWYGYRYGNIPLDLVNALDYVRRAENPGKGMLTKVANGIFSQVYNHTGTIYVSPPKDGSFAMYMQLGNAPLTRRALAVNNANPPNRALKDIYKDIQQGLRNQAMNKLQKPVEY